MRRKCEFLYFLRDDAPEKEVEATNDAKEVDDQGYVLFMLTIVKHAICLGNFVIISKIGRAEHLELLTSLFLIMNNI